VRPFLIKESDVMRKVVLAMPLLASCDAEAARGYRQRVGISTHSQVCIRTRAEAIFNM